MPEMCPRGLHEMTGDNVRRTNVLRSARCRQCEKDRDEGSDSQGTASKRKPRIPLKAELVEALRRADGTSTTEQVVYKRPVAEQRAGRRDE